MSPKIYKWEEPQPNQRGKWEPIRKALREREGEWALVIDGDKGDTPKDINTFRSMLQRRDGYALQVTNREGETLKAWAKYDPENVKARKSPTTPAPESSNED